MDSLAELHYIAVKNAVLWDVIEKDVEIKTG